jgi:DNA-binding response OmpR family regulator
MEIRILKWFKIYLHSLNFSPENKIKYKNLAYFMKENEFHYIDKKITLTKKSKYILMLFISMPERLLTEELLKKKIWCDNDSFKDRNVRICILRLKESLKHH